MLYLKIPLDDSDQSIFLEAFVPDKIGTFVRKAVLIIPGGAYKEVCCDREGEPIAQAFIPHGYAAFVLHYSVDRKKAFPGQLIEAAKAIAHIKDHAQEYGIDADQLFVTGFSAGGHLAACTGILWKHSAIYEALDVPYGYIRPKGMILIYPVINEQFFSFCNLLCTDSPDKNQLETVQLDRHVDADTVPAFIMHTANDQICPVSNALMLSNAMSVAGIPFELHIYPDAPHGIALGNAITAGNVQKHNNAAIAQWIDLAANWAKNVE